MARLGELLVASGLLTAEQVEQALRAQVMWGGRLGTNLIELGFIDLDALSRALGRQHKLPAAQARHFEAADRALQQHFTADIAERWSCVPLMRVGTDKSVVIASADVLERKARGIIAEDLAIEPTQVISAIAAEQRIRYQLERVYQIPRTTRFLRARGPSTPLQTFQILPVEPDSDADIPIPHDIIGDEPSTPIAAPPVAVAARTVSIELDLDPIEPEAVAEPEPEAVAETEPEPEPEAVAETEPEPEAVAETETAAVAEPEAELAELDDMTALVELEPDAEIETDHEPSDAVPPVATLPPADSGRERRRYLPTLGDAEPEPSGVLARVAIRRVAVGSDAEIKSMGEVRADARASARGDHGAGDDKIETFGEAARAIRRSTDRDRVGDLIIDAIDRFAPTCDAAMLLVVRGETGISWKSFCRNGGVPPEVAVPLDQPGLVPSAVRNNTTTRAAAADLGPIDQLLARALGRHDDLGDLVVVPIPIGGEVMCLIATLTGCDAPVAPVETIASAASAAFARLMRAAGR